jgi:hypothetical protein
MAAFEKCTLHSCPLELAYINYLPSIGGNTFYLALFAGLLSLQIILLIFYRTWAFSICMISGLILEILGYLGRIELHSDPFDFTNFALYASGCTGVDYITLASKADKPRG